jgi:hypothetical protein
MPSQYLCSSCQLGFETGWFHYHVFEDGAVAATFVACAKCGTAYMVEHFMAGAPDQLYWWSGPVSWVPTEYEGLYNHAPGTPGLACIVSDHEFRPLRRPNERARLEAVSDKLDLAAIACLHCAGVGALTDNWPDEALICPRCGKETLECVGGYVT